MKKRILSRILVALVFICTLVPMASAIAPQENQIQPRYVTISSFTASISISKSGYATCYSKVRLGDSGVSADLTMELQCSTDGKNWNTIMTWAASGSGTVSLNKLRLVSSGYTYRVYATAKVYSSLGKLIEDESIPSLTQYY